MITYEIGLGLTGTDKVTAGAAAVRALRGELTELDAAIPRAARGAGQRRAPSPAAGAEPTPKAVKGQTAPAERREKDNGAAKTFDAKGAQDSFLAKRAAAREKDNAIAALGLGESRQERAAKRQRDKDKKDAEKADEERKKRLLAHSKLLNDERSTRGLSGVATKFGGATAAAVAAAAAATTLAAAGVAALAPLALGWRAMAQLQFISFRTTFALRRLFKDVDAQPVVRAFDRLTKNLDKSTVTGRVLSGVLTRGFNSLFATIEKAEPYVTAFGQGLLYGFLKVETATLRVRLALLPYTSALEDLLGEQDHVGDAFALGGALAEYFGTGLAIAAAAAGVLAKAVSVVVTGIRKLADLPDTARTLFDKLTGNEVDVERSPRRRRGAGAAAGQAALAVPDAAGVAGKTTPLGAAMSDGVAVGIKSKRAELYGAGFDMSQYPILGFRAGAKIRSPSGVMRVQAHYLGEGVVRGIRDKAPDVQREAARSFTPDLSSKMSFSLPPKGGASVQVSIGDIIIQGADVKDAGNLARLIDQRIMISVNDALTQLGG